MDTPIFTGINFHLLLGLILLLFGICLVICLRPFKYGLKMHLREMLSFGIPLLISCIGLVLLIIGLVKAWPVLI